MTQVEIYPNEFIVLLDADAVAIFQEGKSVNVLVRNPHTAGNYDVSALSLLKVLMTKLKELKPKKKMPSDDEIKKRVRNIAWNTQAPSILSMQMEIYKKAWEDSQ